MCCPLAAVVVEEIMNEWEKSDGKQNRVEHIFNVGFTNFLACDSFVLLHHSCTCLAYPSAPLKMGRCTEKV